MYAWLHKERPQTIINRVVWLNSIFKFSVQVLGNISVSWKIRPMYTLHTKAGWNPARNPMLMVSRLLILRALWPLKCKRSKNCLDYYFIKSLFPPLPIAIQSSDSLPGVFISLTYAFVLCSPCPPPPPHLVLTHKRQPSAPDIMMLAKVGFL